MGWGARFRRKRRATKPVVLFAVPTYSGKMHVTIGTALYEAAALSAKHEFPYEICPIQVVGVRGIDAARNQIVQILMSDPRIASVLQVDDDMGLHGSNWPRLLLNPAPISSGLAFGWQSGDHGRVPQVLPVQYRIEPTGSFTSIPPPSGTDLYEVDAIGAACLHVRREVFQKMDAPWFKFEFGRMGNVECGEDQYFCRKAHALGYKVVVDPNVRIEHYKDGVGMNDVVTYGEKMFMIGRGTLRDLKGDPGLEAKTAAERLLARNKGGGHDAEGRRPDPVDQERSDADEGSRRDVAAG